MAQSTEEIIEMVNVKAKVSTRGPMVVNTTASILMIKDMEKVLLNGPTVANILEDGKKTILIKLEFTPTLRKKRFTVNGNMER